MKQTEIQGVFKKDKRLFTENPPSCKGIKVYNEQLISYEGKEFRSWNPYRSKLAAAILNGLTIKIEPDYSILYLGAATGTTVSHASDLVRNGTVYSVEYSPTAIKNLIKLSQERSNVIPILSDANHPDKYSTIVPSVDLVYQDISQRNQAEIFIENVRRFLKEEGTGILMVKARSIDVGSRPEKIYEMVCSKLKENSLKVIEKIDLKPYEKDHAALIVSL